MIDQELITAFKGAVEDVVRPIIQEELKEVNNKLEEHDKKFEQIDRNLDFLVSEVSQIKQKQDRFEKRQEQIATRQEQQFKFLVTEIGKVEGTIEEMIGGYYV